MKTVIQSHPQYTAYWAAIVRSSELHDVVASVNPVLMREESRSQQGR